MDGGLTPRMNQTRQAQIAGEPIDIVGGAQAVFECETCRIGPN
jgi:F0F1-type ATP synthase gamma subunit